MERLATAGARGALIVDPAGRATGVVNEAAVSATPRERWPWIASSDVSRRLTPALILDSDLAGEQLLRALAVEPATEYVVQDGDGRPLGVLAFADVNAVLNRR